MWHESRLISVAAGPRNGGGLVGIAFQSNLHSIRAISNVLLLTDSQHVVDAIELAAVTVPERNVMNLAFGSPTYKDNIARQIEASSNDMIVMVGAAGTSPSWMGQQHKIAFPARMPEVVAVTGINADGSVCGNCHRNVQIEFGAYTDEPSLNPYAQASHNLAGPHVSISGSSGATAVISGIAALTWSANPGLTAQGVIQRMKSSSAAVQLPNHSPWQSGSGMPNAACAVGGICRIEMQGPSVITEPGHHVYTAKQIASNVDASYDWSTGHTTSSAPLVVTTLPAEDEHVQLSVTVTDHKGVSITRSRTIIIRSATSPPDCPPQVIVCPDN